MIPIARMASHVASVEKYYDVNTPSFARFGRGAGTGTIRRAVWAPSVRSEIEAFTHVDELIHSEIGSIARFCSEPVSVLDLGCGLGGSLCFIAQRLAISGLGITVSRNQVDRARARAKRLGVDRWVRFEHGDYTEPLPDTQRFQVVFSIEAFVHALSPEHYFAAASKLVARGGLLVVCDDVLVASALDQLPPGQARWLRDAREGWFAPSLVGRERVLRAAARAGFVARETRDLTSYLRLGRPRDRALRALLPILGRLPISSYRLRSWRGGDSLQRCLRAGLVGYHYMTWTLQP